MYVNRLVCMSYSVDFTASFGNEDKQVSLTQVAYTAGTTYHIYVDRYFWGWVSLDRNSNQWKVRIQTDHINELLSSTDREILIELVANHFNEYGWRLDN